MPSNSLRQFNGLFPQIGQRVMIDESAVVIGNVIVGDDVSIWPYATVRGDVNQIVIGSRTNIQDGCILHVNRPRPNQENLLIIGNDVTVGHRAVLHGCTLGNRILIGMGAIVLDGTLIEDDVIVGVGSVVTSNKILKSGYLYLGSPARLVRELTPDEIDFLKTSADGYVSTKDIYLNQSR